MKKILSVLARAVKAVLIGLAAAIGRIARNEGKGVFETAVQNAVREIANSYLRGVNA